MKFWINLVGFQLCWVLLVGGAGRGLMWPGLLAASIYTAVHFFLNPKHTAEIKLALIAVLIGLMADASLIYFELVGFATPFLQAPHPAWPPLWMSALWWIFALTLNHSMKFFQNRFLLCVVFGLVGGALSYGFAARTWHAMSFQVAPLHALIVVGVLWAIIFPFLIWLAPRFSSPASIALEKNHV